VVNFALWPTCPLAFDCCSLNLIVGFATGSGEKSWETLRDRNSFFTGRLKHALDNDDVPPVSDMMQRVRAEVVEGKGRQVPGSHVASSRPIRLCCSLASCLLGRHPIGGLVQPFIQSMKDKVKLVFACLLATYPVRLHLLCYVFLRPY
jgi:hypothetical protein